MDDDLTLIDLASAVYKYEGAREAAALEIGWTRGRFWQRVAWLTSSRGWLLLGLLSAGGSGV